jgi:hypothetical protein
MSKKFSFHDKKVTLQLARLSTAADENPAFAAVLNELPGLGFDVNKLAQEGQEILFAEFDEELEERIKGEFVADPSFVIDLGHSMGICPLCGHVGCRWIFRIENKLNGNSIECGSECIVTHGLCVKGAETAEHARKALEATIRRAIKAIKIQAWHEAMKFDAALFQTLENGLRAVNQDYGLPYKVRNSAWYKYRKDLPKLVKFYARTGWLNTEKRWAEWERLVKFARRFDAHTRKVMSYPLPHGHTAGEPVQAKVELPQPHEALTDAQVEDLEATAQNEDLEKQAADEVDLVAKAAEKIMVAPKTKPVQQELPFSAIANDLVFG